MNIAFYDWLPAICCCPSNPGDWERRVFENRRQWTLNPDGVEPTKKTCPSYCTEYFYDMGSATLIEARVSCLADRAAAMGYKALFFDWGTGWRTINEDTAYSRIRDEFLRRHPGIAYDDRVKKRACLPESPVMHQMPTRYLSPASE